MKNKFLKFGAIFFLLGLFTCTWDRILFLDVGKFTFKIQQLFFGLAFLCSIAGRWRDGWGALVAPWKGAFPLCIAGLGIYYFLTVPWSFFPLKSFCYAGWLFYNLLTVWGSAHLLSSTLSQNRLRMALWATLLFHSAILWIDYFAYQFGFKTGLIGFNQDEVLHWGISRPHAFASEPSYIATFLILSLFFLVSFSDKKIPSKEELAGGFFGLVALVFTSSRTGFLSLALGMGLLFFLSRWRERKVPWKKILVGIAGVLLALTIQLLVTPANQNKIINESLISSVLKGKDGSGNSRLQAHLDAAQMALDSKGLGVGLGASYRYWNHKKGLVAESADSDYGHESVMSIWGQLLAEGGLPGLILYGLAGFFLVSALWENWKLHPSRNSVGALVAATMFFCFIAFWLGNIARGDVWVWFAIWGRIATDPPISSRDYA